MMKPLFLVLLVVLLNSAHAFAAPVVRWEYAFVKENAHRRTYLGAGKSGYEYGVELRLQRRTPIFLPYANKEESEAFLLDVFSRLGSKGWELVSTPGYRGPNQYIFKRRK